ncbi:MAG: hypothetical protein WBB33_00855 [Candidatus Saccharimonadales bacterium]
MRVGHADSPVGYVPQWDAIVGEGVRGSNGAGTTGDYGCVALEETATRFIP